LLINQSQALSIKIR